MSEQPQNAASPPARVTSIPRAYINFGAAQGSPTDLALSLGYQQPGAEPAFVADLIMSWEHVPILIELLQQQVNAYVEKVGPIPDVSGHTTIKEVG